MPGENASQNRPRRVGPLGRDAVWGLFCSPWVARRWRGFLIPRLPPSPPRCLMCLPLEFGSASSPPTLLRRRSPLTESDLWWIQVKGRGAPALGACLAMAGAGGARLSGAAAGRLVGVSAGRPQVPGRGPAPSICSSRVGGGGILVVLLVAGGTSSLAVLSSRGGVGWGGGGL